MRRLNLSKNTRSAQERESGAGLSAAAIIARAAATVPNQPDDADTGLNKQSEQSLPSGTPSGLHPSGDPQPRRNRRARRRPVQLLGAQFRERGRSIVRLIVLLALFGFPLWLWQSGRLDSAVAVVDQSASDAGEEFRGALGLRLEHIYVAGRHRTSRKTLSSVLGLDRGASLTAINITALRNRIRALPWVSDAAIERRWPNVLFIRVREHTAIARYQQKGGMKLVARTGDVIDVRAVSGHRDKLLVRGKGAPRHAAALLDILRTRPALANRVVSAVRQGDRRWDLKFDNGAFLKLPEGRPDAAWQRFADLNKTHKLLAKGALGFDMRTRFEFVIRKPGAATEKGGRKDRSGAGRDHRG